jgi:thiol-disulfide isomerase/thioredoxin
MKEITSAREFLKLWTSDSTDVNPFFIWFSASWCIPCQQLAKSQKELENAAGHRTIYYCNISKTGDDSAGYCGVSKLPTVVLAIPGKVFARVEGADVGHICKFMQAHQ